MDQQHQSGKKIRNDDQMEIDRLSNLPNFIIYNILSLMDTKYAVQTCLLSKKWKYHWTYIHSLNFDCDTFTDRIVFIKFVYYVLYNREPFHLHRLQFYWRGTGGQTNLAMADRIFSYAESHHVDELETDTNKFPLSLCDCQTLTTLKLGDCSICTVPDSFGFASLTTLHLSRVWLYSNGDLSDIFSSCLNLENLSLIKIYVVNDTDTLRVSGPRLVNLTISDTIFMPDDKSRKLIVSAPRLRFFKCNQTNPLLLSMDKCPLDKMGLDIQMYPPIECNEINFWKERYISRLVCMVKGLSDAKSLTVALNLLKEKFIIHWSALDAETKVVECNEEILNGMGRSLVKAVSRSIGKLH